ncbi:MAG: radical SAM protein, partial [Deltaproteobacteria bacterium]|nr:radical SAM protein [Deltaproteobacteria bacterium]
GEALTRPDLFALAAHARSEGLVPNLTISGLGLTTELVRSLAAFGQVNVSLDGVGPRYAVHRGRELFAAADRGLRLLAAAGISTGINCVLGKENFADLPELFRYAGALGLQEIEVLRYKPAGRGGQGYRQARCTPEQHLRLVPLLQELSARHGVAAKIDCSLVPMLCAHGPPPELLEALATYGCEAGNVLLGVRSNGQICGCSFLPAVPGLHVHQLGHGFTADGHLDRLRRWYRHAPEPCASCEYLRICKGGCRAVALHTTGSLDRPDPECPRVAAHRPNG